jgi:hypothetical protein
MTAKREGNPGMTNDWTTPEYLADISADELKRALEAHGVQAPQCDGDEDGVTVHLADVRDAELMMSLVFEGTDVAGTLYDRAVCCCVTLTNMAQAGAGLSEMQLAEALNRGWVWVMHPEMQGRRVGWHIVVTMLPDDACQVAARLNELRNGVAL